MKSNNDQLRELMRVHGLTQTDVAAMLHLSVTKAGKCIAVSKWLGNPENKGNFRHMSDANLELLALKLALQPDELTTLLIPTLGKMRTTRFLKAVAV